MDERLAHGEPLNSAEHDNAQSIPRPAERLGHYFAAFASSPDAIVVVDDNGTIREINQAAEILLGYTRSELAGKRIECLVPEAARDAHRGMRRDFDNHPVARVGNRRLTLLNKSGETIPVEIHLGPARVNGANWVVATLQDKREQVAAESALRESEARFRDALEHASIGVVVLGQYGGIIEASSTLAQMLGIASDDLRGRSFLDIAHPDERPEIEREMRRLAAGATEAIAAERRLLRSDGEVVWVQMSASLFDPADDPSPQIVALLQNITERHDAVERLRRSQEKYSQIFNTSPLAITVSTLRDGVFREANASCQSVFGYSREELIGKPAFELGIWVDTADHEELVRRAREVQHPAPVLTHIRRKDGSVRPVEMFAAIYSVDGDELLMGLTMDVSERVAFENQLELQTLYDGVTGLPNRVLFLRRLQRVFEQIGGSRSAVVIALNLDRFKVVNETMGHGAGDDLLLAVANRLRDIIRAPHTVARFSADEFYVLLEDLRQRKNALAIVRESLRIFETPFRLLGTEVHMTASAGVALSSARVKSADELLRHANLALSLAKRNPDLEFHVFDPKEDMELAHRFRRETELWQALERDEFLLHYQPVFNLATHEIIGAEALVRWNHPTDGLLNPGDFIPIAEESALIISISEWVKMNAARYAAQLIHEGRRDGFLMSVNVSARHFMRPHFVERVRAMLQEVRLPPENFEIEVTETVVLRSPEQVEALRDLGVHIAVDDLGTGFSSLEYLTQMNVDTLKVDRVLIEKVGADPRSNAVVEAIKLIGDRLEVRVIAEGIETQRQLSVLRNLGYQHGQGFLLGRPMTADELSELLNDEAS